MVFSVIASLVLALWGIWTYQEHSILAFLTSVPMLPTIPLGAAIAGFLISGREGVRDWIVWASVVSLFYVLVAVPIITAQAQ